MGTVDPSSRDVVTVSVSDYLWFVHLALDQMMAIVHQLGDGAVNDRLTLDGANSPFAIVTHCLGVVEFWGGSMVAGRTIERDRDAEFVATGSVEELVQCTELARRQLEADLTTFDSFDAPPGDRGPKDDGVPYGSTKGAVLLHILEELLQHLGQMEVTRDVLQVQRLSEGPS